MNTYTININELTSESQPQFLGTMSVTTVEHSSISDLPAVEPPPEV